MIFDWLAVIWQEVLFISFVFISIYLLNEFSNCIQDEQFNLNSWIFFHLSFSAIYNIWLKSLIFTKYVFSIPNLRKSLKLIEIHIHLDYFQKYSNYYMFTIVLLNQMRLYLSNYPSYFCYLKIFFETCIKNIIFL